MLKQISITAIITAAIYLILLFLNYELLSQERVTWADYEQYTEKLYGAEAHEGELKELYPNADISTPEELLSSSGVSPADKPYLVGVSRRIALYPKDIAREQSAQIWREFEVADVLAEEEKWVDGTATVYALYDDFSSDLSSAILTIGYKPAGNLVADLALPNRSIQSYEISKRNPDGADLAWADVSPGASLLEKYILASDDSVVLKDVTVIK
jgi:hypothetical protein